MEAVAYFARMIAKPGKADEVAADAPKPANVRRQPRALAVAVPPPRRSCSTAWRSGAIRTTSQAR